VLLSESISDMEDQDMKFRFAVLILVLLTSGFAFEVAGQSGDATIKKGILQSRQRANDAGIDNYEYATFSFLVGANGPEAQKLVRNNWDLQFTTRTSAGNSADYFHVTMVVDDRSRILDLGMLGWSDAIELPDLPAYEKPTREKDVEAKVGHIYYVHTADRKSDHYVLFRVEELKSGESVVISWKLLGEPAEFKK
jgi:hypothetical protein